METVSWQFQIDLVKPHIVRIMTPRGSGTGFLLYRAKHDGFVVIATAAHVVSTVHFWEEPIRFQHAVSGKSTIVRAPGRAILIDHDKDVAAVAFRADDIDLPQQPLGLGDKETYVREGVEIGWLGFPAVSRELCFFSGRVSSYQSQEEQYLIDGVAINGVSGGPVFMCEARPTWDEAVRTLSLVGVVSAYIPNRATGEVLPGLAVAMDIVQLHRMVADFKSLEDAQAQQTPPAEAAAVPSEEPPKGGQRPEAQPNKPTNVLRRDP